MVEVDVLDPAGDGIALVTVDRDLPDASQQLICLGKSNHAVVPAYIVGDGRGADAPAAPAEAGQDLNLTGVVVGLDDPPSASDRRPTADAAADHLFQDMAASGEGRFSPNLPASGPGRSAGQPEAGTQCPDAVSPFGTDLGRLVGQWGDLLAGLSQPVSEEGAASTAVLAEALLTFGMWRLTQPAGRAPE